MNPAPSPPPRLWPPRRWVAAAAVLVAAFAAHRARIESLRDPEPLVALARHPERAARVEEFLRDLPPHPPDFQRGVGLGLFSRNPRYDYGPLLREIADVGADRVALFFNLYQRDGASVEMAPPAGLETQERILREVAAKARDAGLRTMFFPIVLLSRPRGTEWRGNLAPRDRDAWFAEYAAHMRRLASLAEETGAEWFCVGSEFSSLQEDDARWRRIVAEVRAVFSGKLVYSANWDRHERVPFWDALDAIGLSGYYELTDRTDPTVEELAHAWARERNRILAWRREAGIRAPIVFSEVGYPNRDGAARRPWDYTTDAPPDPEEQADAHEAFVRAWHGTPDFAGAYFYNWFGRAAPDDRGYSPRGKPAAEAIRAWYKHTPPKRDIPSGPSSP